MRFSKHHQDDEQRSAPRKEIPKDYWCAECEKMGFIPVTYVTPRGNIASGSAVCRCLYGDQVNDGKRLTYEKAKEYGLLDIKPTMTKHTHWLHAMRRYFELTNNNKYLDLMDMVTASEKPSQALERWIVKHNINGPLAGVVGVGRGNKD